MDLAGNCGVLRGGVQPCRHAGSGREQPGGREVDAADCQEIVGLAAQVAHSCWRLRVLGATLHHPEVGRGGRQGRGADELSVHTPHVPPVHTPLTAAQYHPPSPPFCLIHMPIPPFHNHAGVTTRFQITPFRPLALARTGRGPKHVFSFKTWAHSLTSPHN